MVLSGEVSVRESMDMYKASQHHTGNEFPGSAFYDDLQIIEHEDDL